MRFGSSASEVKKQQGLPLIPISTRRLSQMPERQRSNKVCPSSLSALGAYRKCRKGREATRSAPHPYQHSALIANAGKAEKQQGLPLIPISTRRLSQMPERQRSNKVCPSSLSALGAYRKCRKGREATRSAPHPYQHSALIANAGKAEKQQGLPLIPISTRRLSQMPERQRSNKVCPSSLSALGAYRKCRKGREAARSAPHPYQHLAFITNAGKAEKQQGHAADFPKYNLKSVWWQ